MEYSLISRKIRGLRVERKITIQELGQKTGLTAGYLSKIENSDKPPPIPTLAKIAYALRVHVSYFFEEGGEDDNKPSLIRKRERKEIIGDYTPFGFKYEAIIQKGASRSLKPLIITLSDRLSPERIPYNYHDGEELIYVLAGRMRFFYGDESYDVQEGDCLYFDSSVPHKVIPASETDVAQILSVLSL